MLTLLHQWITSSDRSSIDADGRRPRHAGPFACAANARSTAGLESLLPQAIIVRFHLTAEPSIEHVELFANLLVR